MMVKIYKLFDELKFGMLKDGTKLTVYDRVIKLDDLKELLILIENDVKDECDRTFSEKSAKVRNQAVNRTIFRLRKEIGL